MIKSKRAKRRAEVWQNIQNYKKEQGCRLCGYNDVAQALQFNHTNPENKKGNVSDLIRSDYSLKTIQEEISKCEVLCANCHAEVTHSTPSPQ